MTKLDFMRIEKIENRIDRNHPGRHLAKRWHQAVFSLSDVIEWVWSAEIKKPIQRSSRDIDGDSIQLDDVHSEMEFWRENRMQSWIETFWSSEWDQGQRITGTFYQHPDDPSMPSETETAQLFGFLLASIPTEVFDWARFHMKVWSRSYEKRYMKLRELMDVTVEYTVEDFLQIESRAQYWREKLGPLRPEDILLPTWASNAKLFGHGKTENYPESKFCDSYVTRAIRAYENWLDVFDQIDRIIEADRQKQIAETGDV